MRLIIRKMDARRQWKQRRDIWSNGMFIVSKLLLLLAIFLSYDILVQVPVVIYLFIVNTCCAVVYVLLHRPVTSGKKLNSKAWFRISRHAILTMVTSLLWTCGLSLCGPLRSVLFWEHSALAILSVVNVLLACGSHRKIQGAVLFLCGMLCLIVFDNDHLSHADHPEGSHGSILTHYIYYFISMLGVPDHKGGVVLLLLGLALVTVQSHLSRTLAAQIGGPKRLNALVTFLTAAILSPFAVIQIMTSDVLNDVIAQLPYLVIVALLIAGHYYIENAVVSKLDSHGVARLGSLSMFFGALLLTFLWVAPIDHGLVHHLSAGVGMATILFTVATIILTRPSGGKGKPDGLPLYADEIQTRPMEKIRNIISKIMSSRDSRNIFYFLCLNLSFTFVEFLYGFWSNSLGLISDGFHMLFDCTALLLGLYAAVASQWKSNKTFSYGYGRMEVLSGFVNALFLVIIAFFVLVEALDRLFDPPHISSERLLVVSVGGLIVNLLGIVAFSSAHAHAHGGKCNHTHGHSHSHAHSVEEGHTHSHGSHDHHHHNANMQGIFLHVLADTLGSVAVIISSLLIQQFGWYITDPICSLLLAGLIGVSVIPLLRDSTAALLLAPSEPQKIQQSISKLSLLEGVTGYSHSHFWQLSSSHLVGTIHIQVSQDANEQKIIHTVNAILKECGAGSVTIQVEKEQFASSSLAHSLTQHNNTLPLLTPPQVYVDHGPIASDITAI